MFCGFRRGGVAYGAPMPIVRCASPAELDPIIDRLRGEAGAGLLLFFGSEDPATGESWCPDCVTADPVLRAACARLRPELTLYECPVGPRSAWKNVPDHPYRLHPALRLARIPTLIRFAGGCEIGRLVEADCGKPAAVEAFLA